MRRNNQFNVMDYNNPRPQSHAQILLARHVLASEQGTLPERVKHAVAHLFTCVPGEYQKYFEKIDKNLASVHNDDYSRLKPEELQTVVHAIGEMANEIKCREAVALHKRMSLFERADQN
jgi:hypothetical protein